MMIREPAVAGSFYPSDETACRELLDDCFARASTGTISDTVIGGVVPHAGWMCSGGVMAGVVATIAAGRSPGTVVVFGAVHRPKGWEGAMFPNGRWDTPLGRMMIDERLAERVKSHSNVIIDDPYAHESEHSIEVQIPFIQRVWPDAKLLPIMVPASDRAVEIGDAVGRTLASYDYDTIILASSDLTHYGPGYSFTPQGADERGLTWAKTVNDQRMIDVILAMDADRVVAEAATHRNACGGGAIAAAIASCRAMGAQRAELIAHTTSREAMNMMHEENAVGYAGIVFTGTAGANG